MAKGQQFKKEIQEKILQLFPQSFLYNDAKEIRICGMEDGQPIQIKVVLTCAKENVEMGADAAMPGDFPAPKMTAPTPQRTVPVEKTADEKQRVEDALRALGMI